MKIGILDLCVWLPEFQHDQPRFGQVVATWVRRGLPEATLEVIDIHSGEALPDPKTFDGFVLSGSEVGVYDETEWMRPLRDFLIAAREETTPLFGICFGHQIMADVFGGKAEKIGPQQVGVRKFDTDGGVIKGHVWHQDQVTQAPPDATVIGQADYCPVAALSYDKFPAMSVQFHPEYRPEFLTTFLSRSRGAVLSETATDKALTEFERSNVAEDLYAERMAEFFRGAISA